MSPRASSWSGVLIRRCDSRIRLWIENVEGNRGRALPGSTTYCPNGHAGQTGRYCAECGVSLVGVSPEFAAAQGYQLPPDPGLWNTEARSGLAPRVRFPRWVPRAVVAVLVTVVVAGGAFWIGQRIYDSKRWSDYPHSMGCEVQPDEELRASGVSVYPPVAMRLDQVTLSHFGGKRLQVSLQFQQGVPATPRSVVSPYTRKAIDAPGSLSYVVVLHGADGSGSVQIMSPADGHGWVATQMEYLVDQILKKEVPDNYDPDRNLVESARVDGKTAAILLNLEGIPGLFGHGPFRPAVNVTSQLQGLPSRDMPDGELTMFDLQVCQWETPVAAFPGPDSVSSPQPTSAAPTGTRQGNSVPIPSGGNLHWQFKSPTGNIICDLDGRSDKGVAACEVREHTYRPQVKPECEPGWSNKFTLNQGQTVIASCYPGSSFNLDPPIQQYGHPLTVGALTCVIEETSGVTCTDTTTGHYFQAARQEYKWQ